MLDLSAKKVLITGGTGSFGRAFCMYLLAKWPNVSIRIFSRDEQKQFDMMGEISSASFPVEYVIGDIKDRQAVNAAARGVDIIVHAAAMKHVPMTEKNPMECFKTNIFGSQNLIEAAISNGVRKVVALSTDKAVNPIGAYGASKLALETLFLDADRRLGSEACTFSVVRYGNIFASKGSVAPVFLKMRSGGYLTLTDPESTRFSITLQDSIDLVIFALEHGVGGEIVLPKAPSLKLIDLANAVDADIEKRIVGLRPSEKRHELLFSSREASRVLSNGRFFVIVPEAGRWDVNTYAQATGSSPESRTVDYCSSGNDIWLSVEDLRALLETNVP